MKRVLFSAFSLIFFSLSLGGCAAGYLAGSAAMWGISGAAAVDAVTPNNTRTTRGSESGAPAPPGYGAPPDVVEARLRANGIDVECARRETSKLLGYKLAPGEYPPVPSNFRRIMEEACENTYPPKSVGVEANATK